MGRRRTSKTEDIHIRCSPETKKMFRVFVAENNFRDYEQALLYLLQLAREHRRLARHVEVY